MKNSTAPRAKHRRHSELMIYSLKNILINEWQQIRRKTSVCIDKANYLTDTRINRGFADRKQFSFVWGSKTNTTTGTSDGVWKNYAMGGVGNVEHRDDAAKYAFTFETDIYCVMIDGTNTVNNLVAKQYGYTYMTNFLKYIFDVFDMNDYDRTWLLSPEDNEENSDE